MDQLYLISAAAALGTVAAGIIAAAIIAFTACHMQTKRLKVTRVYADRDSAGKTPKKKKTAGERQPENVDFRENNIYNTDYCRIGLVSDLHFPMISVNTGDVIYRLQKEDCDLVAVAGDLCQNAKGRPQMLDFMRNLAEALEGVPILVVLGNHDAWHVCGKKPEKIAEYVSEISRCGRNVTVLRDETVRIGLKGSESAVVVAGFDEFILGRAEKRAEVFKEAAKQAGERDKLVLLMHNPDVMESLKDDIERCGRHTVALAGHTHGGQVYVPFNFEFRVLRDDKMPRKGYVYGLYDYCRNGKLYITCGLGQSLLPVRLGTTPEIAFVIF